MTPALRTIFDVIDTTWPAAQVRPLGPWLIRTGAGGGSRVSSAIATKAVKDTDIDTAEDAMIGLGQARLFQIRPADQNLDDLLASRGYVIRDPSVLYAAPIDVIATRRPPPVTCFEVWPPLQTQSDIWQTGGIGPGRLAVMDRAPLPKTTLLGRADDTPLGTAFVGFSRGYAMIHALEIMKEGRRKGLAKELTRAAAFWALKHGATHLALVTTRANTAANALYTSLGMQLVGQYHYRIKKDVPA